MQEHLSFFASMHNVEQFAHISTRPTVLRSLFLRHTCLGNLHLTYAMGALIRRFATTFALCVATAFAQTQQADNSQTPDKHPDTNTTVTDRKVSWGSIPRDILHDQKEIWTFPLRVAQGQHLLPTAAIAGSTAGLIIADPHVMPYFQTHARNLDDLNDTFDSTITSAEVAAVPAAFLIAGYARHDEHEVGTALLSAEAYADSAVVDLAMKAVTRRKRPSDVPQGGSFSGTFFRGGNSPFKGSSFPSGHAAGVFSVATVVATRYSRHRWAPWLAYGFAAAISFSRVTTSSHFPSDVFMGAALGYTITRYQTLRPR